MPPSLALLLSLGFSGFLLWRDARQEPKPSAALWIPVAWIFIVGSRFVSQWLTVLGVPGFGSVAMEDGSPIDAAFFLVLILAGAIVLARRRIALASLASQNVWLTVFFVYCFLAIVWSDFPLVAFKRWIKVLGHPIVALIMLTERDPADAIKRVFQRTGYILLPLSVVFIKYFPQIGRGFDSWTGEGYNRGVALTKNDLGYGLMVFSLFFFWKLLTLRRHGQLMARRDELALTGVFLAMLGWLFMMADSATSLACTMIGASTMVIVGSRLVNKRFIGTYIVVALLIAATTELTFGVYARTVEMLGRDPSLTDRTAVWADLFQIDINPVLGAGFESFWLGWRLEKLWAKWWWQPNQAHNGYIETYINLGWVGVGLLVALLVATFRKARRELLTNLDYGRFRLGLLFAIIAYNYTEAAFKGVHLVWTLFHLIALDYSVRLATATAGAAESLPALAPGAATAEAVRQNPRPLRHLPRRTAPTFTRLAPKSGTRTWNWR